MTWFGNACLFLEIIFGSTQFDKFEGLILLILLILLFEKKENVTSKKKKNEYNKYKYKMKPSFSELIIDIEFPDPDQMKTYNIYEKQKTKEQTNNK